MASPRCSRRLQGQVPKEDSLGASFLCQDEFRIEQLPQLGRTDFCQVLIHCQCLTEMISRTSICGNYGKDRMQTHARALPMDENIEVIDVFSGGRTNNLFSQIRVSDDINYYRQLELPNPQCFNGFRSK